MANQNDSIITIEAQPGQILLLGSSGSSQQTQVIFDLSGWRQQFINDGTAQPSSKFGVITLTYMLGGPVVKSSTTFFEEDFTGLQAANYKITWLVESDITNYPGAGVCQITYTNSEGTSFHTTVWQTIVTRSVLSGYGLTESEKDAYASWIIALQNALSHLGGTQANVNILPYGETPYVESSIDASGFVTLNFFLPQAPQGKYINSLSYEESVEDGYQFYYTLYDPSQDEQHQDETKHVIAGSGDLSDLLNGAITNTQAAVADSEVNAELASEWAVGKKLDGTDVIEGETGYQNNAKYYKELAADNASAAATSATNATNAANSATTKATAAAGSATTAQTNAELASRYARGKNLDNTAVSSGDDGYQDNALYYKDQASTSATNATNSATGAASSAETSKKWAIGQTTSGSPIPVTDPIYNKYSKYWAELASKWARGKDLDGTDVSSSDSTYNKNASYYANQAADSASAALSSKNNAATSATNAASSANAAQSWAVGGTNTRTGEDTNNAEYWSQQSLEASTHYPTISSQTGNWLIWDSTVPGYVDSGSLARGPKGDTGSAVNIKGQVATVGDIPSGIYHDGDGYFVGTTTPYDLYVYYDNQWNNNGPLGGMALQLDTNTHSIKFNV